LAPYYFSKMRSVIFFLLLINLFVFGSIKAWRETESPAIRIEISGLKKEKGKILLALFRGEAGFPDQGEKAFKSYNLNPAEVLILPDIPPGTYAFALLHDLDNNGKMTFNFVGYPKDGYSSSPSGGPRFSKPNYKDSKFIHSANGTTLKIQMHY